MTAPVHGLLARLLGPAGPEIGCESCFEELDRYVDTQVLRGQEAADATVVGMREHLVGCPACADEHASLLALVAGESPAGDGEPRHWPSG